VSENHRDDDKTHTHIPLVKDTTVGHYRIVEKIGAGGMGEVYLAEDTELDRKVALKFLPHHLCQDEDCRTRFKREAQAAAKLSHPNIIHVYEVSEYQGRPFFAMEHVEGRSLKEFSSGKDLSIEQILELAIQICEGLHAAHEKGVVHRDIKPSNILIDSHGRAKIVDFGLASVVGKDHLTKTGSTLGTIGYMSPEQVRGQEIDHRSDLFSLGVVLYELVTKQNPFKRDSEAATLKAVSDDLPEPLARFKSGLPEGLQSIIDKSLEKDVKTRYQHADGMLSDLMRVKRSIESGQMSVSGHAAADRKSRMWWLAAALIIVAVIVLITMQPWQTATESEEPDKIMLAVLPFENLGDAEDEYFADGMTGEIISRLSCLDNLGVISRKSVYAYKDMQKTIPEIASELGVGFILEGTIRWDHSGDSSRIRVTPELIEVATDAHLWSDRYDRTLTGVLEVQADIASQVVEALGVTLGSDEQGELARMPTTNIKAYDAYMRALKYNVYYPEEARAAIELYEKAINLDSEFVDAYGQLSSVCIWLVRLGEDTDGKLLDKARTSIDAAQKINPGNRDYLMALAAYEYYINLDYEKALVTCRQVQSRFPNDGLAYRMSAAILRRQGKWDDCLVDMEAAARLNPREVLWEYGVTLQLIRRFDTAMAVFDRLLSLEPGHDFALRSKAELLMNWKGDLYGARRFIEEAQQKYGGGPGSNFMLVGINVRLGDYDQALSYLIAPVLGRQLNLDDFYLSKAEVLEYAGKKQQSRAYYDSALTFLDSHVVQGSPMAEAIYLISRAIALAGLENFEEAIEVAERAVTLLPVSRDHADGPVILEGLALVYIKTGRETEAIAILEELLSIPSNITPRKLELSPEYDPLRDHPRFKALLEKYDTAN
jgi:serine/threonine protein kinase/tetratricopeptide (TPR) repeat protein